MRVADSCPPPIPPAPTPRGGVAAGEPPPVRCGFTLGTGVLKGTGTLASIAYVAVTRAWSPDRQPRMFALLAAAWVVPSLIAPEIHHPATGNALYVFALPERN